MKEVYLTNIKIKNNIDYVVCTILLQAYLYYINNDNNNNSNNPYNYESILYKTHGLKLNETCNSKQIFEYLISIHTKVAIINVIANIINDTTNNNIYLKSCIILLLRIQHSALLCNRVLHFIKLLLCFNEQRSKHQINLNIH